MIPNCLSPVRALAALVLGAAWLVPAAAAAGFRVDTASDTPDALVGDGRCADASGACSLRAAIQEGNARGRARIRLARNVRYTLSLAGAGEDAAASGDLDITGRIKILGRDATVDAAGLDRAFDVRAGGDLRLSRLVVTGGAAPAGEHGGGLRNAGRFDVKRAVFQDNAAPGPGGAGGALFNAGGTLRIRNTRLSANSASDAGGALAVEGGWAVVDRSLLRENASDGAGGALHVGGSGELWVASSALDGNRALRGGGVSVADLSDLYLLWSRVEENEATGDDPGDGGGAIYNEGDALVFDSLLADNAASGAQGAGGAALHAGAELRVIHSAFEQNRAVAGGGAVEAAAGSLGIERALFSENQAGGDGGALRVGPGSEARMFASWVLRNDAGGAGGGLWCSSAGALEVRRSAIAGNAAPAGAQVFNEPPGGDFSIDGDPVPPG